MSSFSTKDVLNKLQEGSRYHGDCGSPMDKKPDWLEIEHFHRGRHVFLNHPYSVSTGSGVGVYWMSQITSLVGPVLFTGNTSTILKARLRLLGTLKRVYQWYNGDVWNPNDEAHRSVKCLRKIHDRVSKRIQNASDATRTTPAISQYDMALTQFSFIGATILYPEKLGLIVSDEDLMCLIHYWAGIGYLLGIEDRYNLGLQCSSLQEYRRLFGEIVERVVKPSLAKPKLEYVELLFRASKAYRSEADLFGDHASLMHFSFEMIGVPVTVAPSGWDTTICRTARSTIIAWVNTPVIGHMIDAYALYVHIRASGDRVSHARQVFNAVLKPLRFANKLFAVRNFARQVFNVVLEPLRFVKKLFAV